MPICKKCGHPFPKKIEIDNKQHVLRNRKYCLECSPFLSHNTKQLEKTRANPLHDCICQQCGRHYQYDRSKGSTLTFCNSCMVNSQRFLKKQRAIEYKGNKCQICGYDKCSGALHFHHVNEQNKLFEISGNYCRKWESIQLELDKCTLVCANCHAELHSK